jgi:Excreted virulence factor EspC, type VII ESX diderm
MTDQQQNLQVVTDHITLLAGKQQTAADKLLGANRTSGDVSDSVASTHGYVCWATTLAVSNADTARKAAGAALFRVSNELSEKLTTAANNYNNADYMAGRSLGQACRM